MLTVNKQFGIAWPPAFQRALAALAVVSLDLGILTSLLCIVNLSFYANLLCTTLLLVALTAGLYLADLATKHRQQSMYQFVGIYLLLFAYPIVSVKVVGAFGCHDIEYGDGRVVSYLSADYR